MADVGAVKAHTGIRGRLWLLLGVLLSIALFASAAVFVERQRQAALAADARVAHTLVVLQRALEFDTALLRMELAHRGYLVAGDQTFIATRDGYDADAASQLARLRQLTSDNPEQQQRLDRIGELLEDRRARMRETTAAVAADGLDAGRRLLRTQGDGSILPLRAELEALRDDEHQLLRERNAAAAAGGTRLRWAAYIAPALGLLVLFIAGRALLGQLAAGERLRRDLLRANAMQQAMLDGAGYLIIGTDHAGIVSLFNRAASEALGYRPEEVIGKLPARTFHDPGELAERAAELGGDPFATVRSGDSGVRSDDREWTYVRRDGSRFPVQLSVAGLRDADGELLGFIGMAQDITTRKAGEREVRELNQQLQTTVQELESFSYSVSHDLRAPLRHIDGYARMLVEDIGDGLAPEPQRFLQAIGTASRRMGQLIDDLLALSRLGRKPLAKQPVDMAALAREAWGEIVTDGVPADALKLGDLPAVAGDPALLRQVWLNLLGNAAKYSRDRGEDRRVEVNARRVGDRVHFTVADNGVGFDMRYADKLFGVFQRLHAQDQFEGTGVGLAIVHRIVVRHGGKVWADAEPGAGARFHFELPEAEGR
ncbi:sensor histidine kinase [Arenimonas composti]|uniref:histidine kinase n=1 Tax=Arenimonas composti TR7-09 = DSM 18010 TaxID=1121013 RepID=A0A091BEV0_9GAMM|nr:sensor histidine kinase [Arenimonas composti]KFN50042.1 hypothetical protein P873_08360 [Arenimonas composti TR7-09 = DSM 18010]